MVIVLLFSARADKEEEPFCSTENASKLSEASLFNQRLAEVAACAYALAPAAADPAYDATKASPRSCERK